MLTTPVKGFARSVNAHNVRLDVLADWIEGCITFDDEVLSQSDIVDVLLEDGIYDSQDFAKTRVGDAYLELKRRSHILGEVCPFSVHGLNVNRLRQWQETPSYSFCLMLSLQVSYRDRFKKLKPDYSEQGILFERLTSESLSRLGWKVHLTGWSKKATASIRNRLEALSEHLGEPSRTEAIGRWTAKNAKDGGLDIACYVPFADGWSGRPLYLVQCASGDDWEEKRHTPNLRLWDKLLDMATAPSRGLSIPFALSMEDFRKAANYEHLALLLDRHRICAPVEGTDGKWMSKSLLEDLNKWTNAHLKALLTAKAS